MKKNDGIKVDFSDLKNQFEKLEKEMKDGSKILTGKGRKMDKVKKLKTLEFNHYCDVPFDEASVSVRTIGDKSGQEIGFTKREAFVFLKFMLRELDLTKKQLLKIEELTYYKIKYIEELVHYKIWGTK